MPRNTLRSWSVKPRMRPAVVRTTTPPGLAAPAQCAAQALAARPALSNRRRPPSNAVSILRMDRHAGLGPVLDQLRPRGRVDALYTAQAEPMAAAIEHVQFAAHAGGVQGRVHRQ